MHLGNSFATVPGEKEPLPEPTKEHKVVTAYAIARRVREFSIHNLKKNNSYAVPVNIFPSSVHHAEFFNHDEIGAWIWKSSHGKPCKCK